MTIDQSDAFRPAGPHAYATGPQAHVNTGPQAYVTTGPHGVRPPAPGGPLPSPRKGRNIVGIAAFAVAVLGFVFAVWEGAYLLGWVLLPIAFVLSLVALFQSGKGKKLAVGGLIISIVGTIAGVFAFTSSAARVLDEAFSGGPVTATAPVAGADAAESAGTEAGIGTRANPYPLGTAVSSRDWTITVNSFDADATDEVMAENGFNESPAAGHTYALANVTATYIGADSGTPMEIAVSYVTSAGNTVQKYDSFAVAPDALSTNELYAGASATGNVALMIPEGDAGTLRIRPGVLADEVFVAIA